MHGWLVLNGFIIFHGSCWVYVLHLLKPQGSPLPPVFMGQNSPYLENFWMYLNHLHLRF